VTLPWPCSQSPSCRHAAEHLDVLPEEGTAAHDHLEAVIIAGIVAAGDLDAAIDIELGFGEIEHWGRANADPDNIQSRLGEAAHQLRLERRGMSAPVAAQCRPAAAAPAEQRAEGPSDRIGIGFGQRFPDDAADVVFAQRSRVETMHSGAPFG
jgi:hypothetical protein